MSTNEHQAHGLLLQEVHKERAEMVEAANKLRPRPDLRAQLEALEARRSQARREYWFDRLIRRLFRLG